MSALFHTLFDGIATTIQLPAELFWEDEASYSAVESNLSVSLGGSSVIQSSERLASRPITLVGDQSTGWVTQAVVDQLFTLAQIKNTPMTFTHADSRVFSVLFRHHEPPVINPEALLRPDVTDPGQYYAITIKLMVV